MFAQSDAPAYLSPEAAARHIGVTRRTIDRYITDGTIPAYRAGARAVRIRLDDLEKFMVPVEHAGTITRTDLPSVGALMQRATQYCAEHGVTIGTAKLQRLAAKVRDDLELALAAARAGGDRRVDPTGEAAVNNTILSALLDEVAA